MIVTPQVMKVLPNGKKWERGVINLSKDVFDKLDRKEQVVTLVILKEGEVFSDKELDQKLQQVRRIVQVENELKKLKGEL